MTPSVSYDPDEQIMFVGFANQRFTSKEAIERAFATVRAFWRTKCGGRKVYAVIDYTNVEFDDSLTELYSSHVKRAVDEFTITTVRYTTDVHMRATLRVVGMTIHKPSNLYATREDAIEMVRALRAKKATVESGK
jgi:hypothetical protein